VISFIVSVSDCLTDLAGSRRLTDMLDALGQPDFVQTNRVPFSVMTHVEGFHAGCSTCADVSFSCRDVSDWRCLPGA